MKLTLAISGALMMLLTAFACAAPFAYFVTPGGNLLIVDSATNTLAGTVAIGANPFAAAANTAGTRVYATNFGGGSVSVIDTSTNSVITTIPVAAGPQGVALNPAGTRAYVASFTAGFVPVIDTGTNTVITSIPLTEAVDVVVNPAGTRLYVAASTSVVVVDTSTNDVLTAIPAGGPVIGMALAPDGAHLYVRDLEHAKVVVIDTASNSVIGSISVATPFTINGLAFNPAGTRLYVSNGTVVSVIDPATNSVVDSIPLGTTAGAVNGVAVTPDGARVYAATASGVLSIDTATKAVVTVLPDSVRALGHFIGPAELGITVGSPETVMTASQRISAGLNAWPDGSMGFFLHGGTNYVFAAGGPTDSQGLTSVDLNSLATNFSLITTTTQIPLGGPGAFDQNYAGVGPVYYDVAHGVLIGMYHGEYWYGGPLPFYAGLGLAVSDDLGVTWTKLGQVLSPQTARTGSCQVDVSSGTLVARPDGYFYTYYDDEAAGCVGFNIALARAKISDVVAAAVARALPAGNLWFKYFNGAFTEPGVTDRSNPALGGGAFTTLFDTSGNAWFPSVAWNSAVGKYVMAYAAGWTGIAIRVSDDGITWSAPTQVVSGGTVPSDGNAIYYPNIVNTSGGNPNILGPSFYLYWVNPFGDWALTNLKRAQLTLTGLPVSPPTLQSAASRKTHGAAGTFDLPLSLADIHNPTTEPRQGPAQTIVFTFDKAITGASATTTEGTATAAPPTFVGNDVIVGLTGVSNKQYVTIALTNVSAADGGTGGSGSVRVGFLLGDVSQNRVVTVSDLVLVNAQIAHVVTSANFLRDVNANGFLTVSDKVIVNANITKALPAP